MSFQVNNSALQPLSSSLISPIDSFMEVEKKIKTVEEAWNEVLSCPFAFNYWNQTFYTGTHHSKVFIYYSGINPNLDVDTDSIYLGFIYLSEFQHQYVSLAFDIQVGKYYLEMREEPTEVPSLKYDSLYDLFSQHPLLSPYLIFDQPLCTDSLMIHSVDGSMNKNFYFEKVQIFKDEPIGRYFISFNSKDGYVYVKVSEDNRFIALTLPSDHGKSFIPNPLELSSLNVCDPFSYKILNEDKSQMLARIQQISQQGLLSPINSHLDFSRLIDIPPNKRRMYIENLSEDVKSKVTTLRLGHTGDLNLLSLMVEFAATCPSIKKIIIPVAPDSSVFPFQYKEHDFTTQYVSLHNSFSYLTGRNCSLQDLESFEQSLIKLKEDDVERYNCLLSSFLPSLFHYVEKLDWEAYFSSHYEVKSSLKDDRDLLESGEFSDYALVVEGKSIPVHRGILIRFTDNLRQVIRSNHKDSKSTEKVIEGYSYDIVKKALEYIYSDENIEYEFEDSFGLCKLANEWGIAKLRSRCEVKVVWDIIQATKYENGFRQQVVENLNELLFDDALWSIWDKDTQAYILDNLGKILPYIKENVEEADFNSAMYKMLERCNDLMRHKIKEAGNLKQNLLKV